MGKRNRPKNKKTRACISKIAFIAPKIPTFLELQSSKETFLEELKKVYTKSLTDFREICQIRIDGHTCVKIQLLSKVLQNSSHHEYFIHDPSNEFFHIFYVQVNQFLNALILTIREVHQNFSSLLKLTLCDAYRVLESTCRAVSQIAANLYKETGVDCEAISFALYKEKLINDNVLGKYSENIEEKTDFFSDLDKSTNGSSDTNNTKPVVSKRSKKRKKKEKGEPVPSLLDKEIEDFALKLAQVQSTLTKLKPNFSEDFIASLKKKLRDRVIQSPSRYI